MVKERRSKNIGRKQRQKNNTHKRRVSKRNTLRRKSFRGGRPRARAERVADFFKYETVPVNREEIGKIKVSEIITEASVLYYLKHDDLVTVKMVGTTDTGKIFFPYTTRINTFNVKGSGLGIISYFATQSPSNEVSKYIHRKETERQDRRYARVQSLIGEEITDKDELSKVRTLFEALKGYVDLTVV